MYPNMQSACEYQESVPLILLYLYLFIKTGICLEISTNYSLLCYTMEIFLVFFYMILIRF